MTRKVLIDITPKSVSDPAHSFDFRRRLKNITHTLWPNESYDLLTEKLKKLEMAGPVYFDKSKECWTNPPHTHQIAKTPGNGSKLIEHYVSATIYSLQLKATRFPEKKFALIKSIEHHLSALEWHLETLNYTAMTAQRAVAGGNSAKTKKAIAIEKLEELLGNPPAQGWGSMDSTAETLAPELEKFANKEGITHSVGDPFNFIRNAISPNRTHAIYSKNAKKN